MGPDAGLSPWGAASTCRQPKGIIPAEDDPRKRKVLSCCHVLDLDSHDPDQGNIQACPSKLSREGGTRPRTRRSSVNLFQRELASCSLAELLGLVMCSRLDFAARLRLDYDGLRLISPILPQLWDWPRRL